MNAIYLNNFRGITKTTIPLFPANFMIGENSTGKTSVLNIISLMLSPQFWFTLSFNNDEYEFGGFRDIVNFSAKDKKEFQIGLFKECDGKGVGDVWHMLHFREGENGQPKLVRYSQLSCDYIVTIRFATKRSSIYASKSISDCTQHNPDNCFEFLLNLPRTITKGYKVIGENYQEIISNNPLFMISMIVEQIFPDFTIQDFSPLSFPIGPGLFASLAPIRSKPKRTYDGYTQTFSSEGEHTPYLIRSSFSKKRAVSFHKALNEFGKESGLFSSIGISEFQKNRSAPFELMVNLPSTPPLRINSVGYGISQVLPVIVELIYRPEKTWFAVQQPEVHLHPRAQAALGDVFFQAAYAQDKVLIVETHSDYLIDRFRLNFRKNTPKHNFAQILFFERIDGKNKITQIKILSDGEYPEVQPKGFRSFFLEEQRKILGF